MTDVHVVASRVTLQLVASEWGSWSSCVDDLSFRNAEGCVTLSLQWRHAPTLAKVNHCPAQAGLHASCPDLVVPERARRHPVPVKTNLIALGNIAFRATTAQRTRSSKQFQIKGEAIAHACFTEILYLDSDNVPVRDPTFLFDAPLYKRHGIVLWPDFVRESPANPVLRLLGFDCDPEEFTAESGQVLVNREGQGGMNQAALLAAEAMQRDSAFWFRLSMGDKDTFRYA